MDCGIARREDRLDVPAVRVRLTGVPQAGDLAFTLTVPAPVSLDDLAVQDHVRQVLLGVPGRHGLSTLKTGRPNLFAEITSLCMHHCGPQEQDGIEADLDQLASPFCWA